MSTMQPEFDFILPKGSVKTIEMREIDTGPKNESLTEQARRCLGRSGFVLVDAQPLEAVGSIPMTLEEIDDFALRIKPFVDALTERIDQRSDG